MLVAPLVVPLVVDVVLTYPSGRALTPIARAVVLGTYAEAALVTVVSALFRNPFHDPNAWANDTGNVLVVRSVPISRAVVVADQWFTLALAVVVATLCAWRVAVASPPARRALLPVALPAALFMLAAGSRAALLLRTPLEDPGNPGFRGAFLLACSAVIALAAALAWGLARTRLQHRVVSRIASSLGEAPAPGSLEAALGRAVGDPTLRIAYWLPDAERYVDASGHGIPAPVGGARPLTHHAGSRRPARRRRLARRWRA